MERLLLKNVNFAFGFFLTRDVPRPVRSRDGEWIYEVSSFLSSPVMSTHMMTSRSSHSVVHTSRQVYSDPR
jgi:hypothetical protein